MRDSLLLTGHWAPTGFLDLHFVKVEPWPLLDHTYNAFMFSRHLQEPTCPRCFSCHTELKLMKLSILWGIRICASTTHTVGGSRPSQHLAVRRKTTSSLEITVHSHTLHWCMVHPVHWGALVAALSFSSCLLSSTDFICPCIEQQSHSSPSSPRILIVDCLWYHSSTVGGPASTLSRVPH